MQPTIRWLNSLLEQYKPSDLTAGDVTTTPRHVTQGHQTTVTLQPETAVTAMPNTTATAQRTRRKHKYKARSRRCKACRTPFTPTTQRKAKYCSDKCRQKGNRAQKARQNAHHQQPAAPQLTLYACAWCPRTWLADPSKHPKYCTAACRTAAYRQRRSAAAETLAALKAITVDQSLTAIQQAGMEKTRRYLKRSGYSYNEAARSWIPML